ncbi:hypothetical protein [Saccharospirillum impatiens]|uniref:hypothetical protein n=1 Tax=Saccharospirillum impatiens TaxID=169438 RepID=UPI0003FB90F7|nr:hypothetical protein [Saccharospirillum impatiens]
MKHLALRTLTGLMLTTLLMTGTALADLVIVVHPSNTAAIDQSFLKNLYLGNTRQFSDGTRAEPLDLPAGDSIRETFLRAIDQTPVKYRRHWSKALFTTGQQPPMEMNSSTAVISAVATNPAAIGYADSEAVNDSVKVVMRVRQ